MVLDGSDGSTIDGEAYVKKIDWSVKSPFVRIPWRGDVAELTFGGETVRLDFRTGRARHRYATRAAFQIAAPWRFCILGGAAPAPEAAQ